MAHAAAIGTGHALQVDRVANTRTPFKGVFVFVRRTPANNVRKCSCSLKMFASAVRFSVSVALPEMSRSAASVSAGRHSEIAARRRRSRLEASYPKALRTATLPFEPGARLSTVHDFMHQ